MAEIGSGLETGNSTEVRDGADQLPMTAKEVHGDIDLGKFVAAL